MQAASTARNLSQAPQAIAGMRRVHALFTGPPPREEATDQLLARHCRHVAVIVLVAPPAGFSHLAVFLLLQRNLLHQPKSFAPLPPQLVALQHCDGFVEGHGRPHVQLQVLLLVVLVRARQIVLLVAMGDQVVPQLPLRFALLDEVLGHRQLQHVWRELKVHQDVVQVDVLLTRVCHQPRLDLQQTAHRALQRLLDADALLWVHHLQTHRPSPSSAWRVSARAAAPPRLSTAAEAGAGSGGAGSLSLPTWSWHSCSFLYIWQYLMYRHAKCWK
eukprot:COSAG01_NODE_8104_length_2919_cov_7.235106_1_plen_273_part_00